MPSLLQRLKERKLVQWALAYLAGGFVVFQGIEVVAEPWSISPAFQRAIHILLLIGLFVTLVLAWYHGERGQQRVSGPELCIIALLLFIAGGVMAVLRGGEVVSEATDTSPLAALDSDRHAVAVLDPDRPAVAVLPFTDMSAEGDQRYFGDGIADEILNSLTRISGLRVAARTSAFKLREEDVATVGESLRVGAVLEGSVRRAGDRVRITAQLIQVEDGFHLWSGTYDRVIEDLFAVQEEIAEAIADALEVELGLHRDRGLTDDLEAYQLYMLGRDRLATRSPVTLRESIEYFERAIERDSTFALAYSGIADAYLVLPSYDPTVERSDVYEPAKAAATRALEFNANLGEIYVTLGLIAQIYEWDWEGAERYYLRALELAPNYVTAHHWYGNLLSSVGRFDQAVEEIQTALSLDPLANALVWSMASRLGEAGRTEEARAHFERALQMEPVIPWALLSYAAFLLRVEPADTARAADLLGEFAALYGYPDPERVRAFVLASGQDTDGTAGLAVLDDIVERTVLERTDLILLYCVPVLADVYFDVLEDAVDARHFWVQFLPSVVSVYEPELMEDPRWQAFLNRIGNPGSRQ